MTLFIAMLLAFIAGFCAWAYWPPLVQILLPPMCIAFGAMLMAQRNKPDGALL